VESSDAGCLNEDTALAFLARSLDKTQTRSVVAHAADCGRCRRFLTTLASTARAETSSRRETTPDGRVALGPVLFELQPGDCVDRYVIRRRVGTGAMGVVYAAFDPQLDREVALKILDHSPPGLGEARAMAQIAHPNIVPVFDAGTHDGHGFVAMELVRGTTLARWLRDGQPQEEILARFREAAAGLAAVHARGLLHGDFKPENVLVGDDGRARVADFGLAQPVGASAASGTPAYMAPERIAGRTADARADQFSFCVALFEALCGHRPDATRPRAPSSLPRRVRQVVERGLASDPDQRFASMDELATALARIARPRYRLALGALLIVAVAGTTLALRGDDRSTIDCDHDGADVAAIWNPRVKHEVELAFAKVALPSDRATFAAVAQLLDTRAAEWATRRRAACEAHKRGDESAALLVQRTACFDAQLVGLAALLELFAQPDAEIVTRALQSARATISLERCSTAAPPRTAPGRDSEGMAIRRSVARARALQVVGKLTEARDVAEALVPRAEYDPRLTAQVLSQLGSLLDDLGEAKRAEDVLLQGVSAAERGADDSMKATLLVQLVWVVGISSGRFDEAERLGRLATAALDRTDDRSLRATLAYSLGNVDDARGRHAQALARYELALAIDEEIYGVGAPETAPVLNALGVTAGQLHQLDKSLAYLRRALLSLESLYGRRHPMIALTLINVAQVLAEQGDLADAISTDLEALSIQEEVFGPTHEKTAMVVVGLADIMKVAKRWDEALTLYHRAASNLASALGDRHPMLVAPWFGIGTAERALGHAATARPWLERALALCNESGMPPEQCEEIRRELDATATPTSGSHR
jgi:tetratricopeptide (TPR) repeat protein